MGLRTDLILVFQKYFGCGELNAMENLLRIHKAGYEFETKKEFRLFLKKNWPNPDIAWMAQK